MKDKIIKVHTTGDKAVKEALEKEFGKEFFITDIIDRVKTFEDAIDIVVKTKPEIHYEYLYIRGLWGEYAKRLIAEYKLMVICEALNEGWIADWSNGEQRKYYPWFVVGGSANTGSRAGFGYVDTNNVASDAHTSIGSRLCFKSEKLARYAGQQFTDLYKEYLLG